MRFRLLAVGRPGQPEPLALHDRYAERLRRCGAGYDVEWVRAPAAEGCTNENEVRRKEAEALLRRCDGKGTLVALDERGRLLSSEELAGCIERWSTPVATFLIGGPLGLCDDLCDRADERWSLSPLTFPHELVPALVAEQLYRALAIRRGLPYHKPRTRRG